MNIIFDYQDDSQDRQVAEIRGVRSVSRARNIEISVTDIRIERENMVKNGELNKEQFEWLELLDGRLQSGASVITLFFSNDKEMSDMLSGTTIENYQEKIDNIYKIIATSTSNRKIKKAQQAYWAIIYMYEPPTKEEGEDTVGEDTSYEDGEKYDNKRPVGELENDNITDRFLDDGKLENESE